MNRFSELFWSRRELPPGDQQACVRRTFSAVVAQSPFHLWSPGMPVTGDGRRLLLGIASYSEYDMRLLDLLESALDGGAAGETVQVDVFDVLDCTNMTDFEHYIPGIGSVLQTPVVGVWVDGVLQAKGTGAEAREKLVVEPFHLDWASQTWSWSVATP